MSSRPFPTTLADLKQHLSSTNNVTSQASLYSALKTLRHSTLSIHNRLNSILYDASFVREVFESTSLPLIANERCGSWYIPPELKAGSAYFKSTDGHHGQWSFSLRRLNLQLLDVLGTKGGAIIVDSTRRGKNLPDALSKTVPIWAAVMNRLLFPEQGSFGRLQTPTSLGASEVSQIEARLNNFVIAFQDLGIDISELRRRAVRPIRIFWAVNGTNDEYDLKDLISNCENEEITTMISNKLILCSASHRVYGAEMSEGGYIQGAGDDSEGWSYGLTPQIFWKHTDQLLKTAEDDLPQLIHSLLEEVDLDEVVKSKAILIQPTHTLYLGDEASLKGNEQLHEFDIVIHCNQSRLDEAEEKKKTLSLGCRTGKMGSKDLRERFLMVKDFVLAKIQQDQQCRILVTCSTGRDLSVGVILVVLCLFFNNSGQSSSSPQNFHIDKQFVKQRLTWVSSSKPDANPSRATLQAVNSFLMDRPP